jgi:hypothetical protein
MLLLQRVAVVAALLAGGAVSSAPPTVTTFGTIERLVRERDVRPKVVLTDVLRMPHAHALGSISALRGEITILDGAAWLSYPPARTGRRPKVVVSTDSREQAGFLVAAHIAPGQWRKTKVDEALSSDGLEAALRGRIEQAGLGGADIPFRIDGRFATLTLAIVDGRLLPAGARTPEAIKQANHLDQHDDVDGTLIGFFAAAADERFTHADSRVHVHAVVTSARATGHARTFMLAPGATLWLPARP